MKEKLFPSSLKSVNNIYQDANYIELTANTRTLKLKKYKNKIIKKTTSLVPIFEFPVSFQILSLSMAFCFRYTTRTTTMMQQRKRNSKNKKQTQRYTL